jgi:hypothetical protein
VSPNSTRTTAVLVVVATFIAGLFVGIAGDRLYLVRFRHFFPRRAAEFAARNVVDHLDRELHLNPQQKTEIQQIIENHRKRIDGLWTSVRPQVRQELDAANAEIEKVLTPEQREKFSKMRMRTLQHRGLGPRGGRPRSINSPP